MSTLRADTIQNTSGGAVTLTNQEAVKAHLGFNMAGATYLGMATDTINSDSFNFSSVTDTATGAPDCSFTSSMSSNQYTFLSGAVATNNLACIKTESTSSVLEMQYNDADSSDAIDWVGYASVLGDLA